jgi:hypothetical protein
MTTKVSVFFFVFTISLHAQERSAIFDSEVPVTWLGVDFSSVRFIGDRARLGSRSDVHKLMMAINDLVLHEPAKYNVAAAIGRSSVENAIEVTRDHNEELELDRVFTDDAGQHIRLSSADIQDIVSSYDFKGKPGLGLMFVAESFNKLNEEGTFFVTFVDLDARRVLFTERMTAKPAGIGLRNYWGRTIYNILTQIKLKQFEIWKKRSD